jgi:hypothetical protein
LFYWSPLQKLGIRLCTSPPQPAKRVDITVTSKQRLFIRPLWHVVPRTLYAYSTILSFSPTPARSLLVDNPGNGNMKEQIIFPSYDEVGYFKSAKNLELLESLYSYSSSSMSPTSKSTSIQISMLGSPDRIEYAADDSVARSQPSRNVDYLSHDWKEEDIWSSWKLIVSQRKTYDNSVRLENASWRTWTKLKNKLKTISPECLNWSDTSTSN